MKMYEYVATAIGIPAAIIFFIAFTVGPIYWIWMSIQLGSFFMFFLGIAGPVVFFTGPIGLYSLFFGIPDWVYNMFF